MNLPLELLFNLLSLARRAPSARALLRQLRARQLYYGPEVGTPAGDAMSFGFWFKLAQAAALIDETPRPTWFVPEWLELPWELKFFHLLEAWTEIPASPRNRETRQKLLWDLRLGNSLSITARRELAGLKTMEILNEEALTDLGQILLEKWPHAPSSFSQLPETAPWYTRGEFLWVPYPPDYRLLWELEAFLDPVDPGVYALDARALRLARQRALVGDVDDIVETLPALLAHGMALSPEEALQRLGQLAYHLDDQPTITLTPGFLLTFSDSEELRRLRQGALLPLLDGTLSKHHLFLSQPQADPVLSALQKRGLLEHPGFPPPMPQETRSHETGFRETRIFSKTDLTALLSALLFAEGAHASLRFPAGLFEKLIQGLPLPLRVSASRQAWSALEKRFPRPPWMPEPEPPEIPQAEILIFLEHAITRQASIRFLYQKAHGYHPESRHVTPLLIEQRGLRFYLIGYCHTRRANRMFRVDRMQFEENL